MKIAIIDVGSNSVRLMTWADGKVLYKTIQTTRLGEGIASGYLSQTAMERTANAVTSFVSRAKEEGANEIDIFATAAVRSAKNGGEFCDLVKRLSGLTVDVVSGEEEALLALSGVLGADEDGGIVDIGGASAEVCMKRGEEISFSVSMNLGAVRLFDACGQERALLMGKIEEFLPQLDGCVPTGKVYAVGGTATTLGALFLRLPAYDGKKVQNLRLTLAQVEGLADRLLSLSTEQKKGLAGMDEKRADIIGGGALFLVAIMQKLRLEEIYISDRDNQEGYLARRRGL